MSNIFVDRQGEIYTINPYNYTPKKALDTVKVCFPDGKFYLHHDGIYNTRKEVRQILSQESGGAWIEQTGQKQRYFLDKGWISSDIYEVGKEEFFNSQNRGTFVQKVTGLALGALSLAPGVISSSQHLPFSPISSQNVALALLAVQQKNPSIALLGSYAAAVTNTSSTPFMPINITLPSASSQQAEPTTSSTNIPPLPNINNETDSQINTYSFGNQEKPDVASLKGNRFVVVWQGRLQGSSGLEIVGQLYERNGTRIGNEFQINSFILFDQENPRVAGLSNGGFVVVWQGLHPTIDILETFYQLFAPNGSRIGSETLVYPNTTENKATPDVASSFDRFIVTWQNTDQGTDGPIINLFAQRFTNDGEPVAERFRVNTQTSNTQSLPNAQTLENGGFLITWSTNWEDDDNLEVDGQLFDDFARQLGSEFQLNTYSEGAQTRSRTASLSPSHFVATWHSGGQDGSSWGIYGQVFSYNGTAICSEFQVNSFTEGDQSDAVVAANGNSTFFVVWESNSQDGDGDGIVGKFFKDDAAEIGEEFVINTYTVGNQQNPALASFTDGGFVAVWQSSLLDGDGEGIFGKLVTFQEPILSPTSQNGPCANVVSSSSSLHTPIESPSSYLTTSTSVDVSSTSSTPIHTPPIVIISYEEATPFYVNGQQIGFFTFTGGTGYIDSSTTNTITIEFTDGYLPEDGETIVLFTIPESEADAWEGVIVVVDQNTSCLEGEGYSSDGNFERQEDGSLSYLVSFEKTSCATADGGYLKPLFTLSYQL